MPVTRKITCKDVILRYTILNVITNVLQFNFSQNKPTEYFAETGLGGQ